jgi:hypothetical protein
MAVLKYVPLFTERVKLQLRGELFKTFNPLNFNDSTTNAPSSPFGRNTGAGAGRVIQLAAKLGW